MEKTNSNMKFNIQNGNEKETAKRTAKRNNTIFYLICLVPAFVCFLIFIAFPTVDMVVNSFYKWNGLTANKQFISFLNYENILKSGTFWKIFRNTMLFIFVPSFITIILAMLCAFLLTSRRLKGKTFFRVVFYFPNILSIVVIAGIFTGVLNYNKGILNAFLDLIGASGLKHYWLEDGSTVKFCMIFIMIWQAIGYYMVMYIAGMDSIPTSLYESADLEGASGSRQFFSITLPLTWEVVRTTFTFFIISSINLAFVLVNAMTNGGPDNESNVLLNYMYRIAYSNGEYGYGMAIGVVLFIVTFGLSLIIKVVSKREIDTN